MRSVLFLLGFMIMTANCYAQYTYTIKADSVKITNSCDSAELIIENHTQGVQGGFLYNTGNGRTIFQRMLQKINDTVYLIGIDSLKTLTPASLSSAMGYNVEFLYGNGNSGIPIKGGDSTYTNANLVGRHLMVYFNGPFSSSIVQDSLTWVLLGSKGNVPYFRFKDSLGTVTFCNMQNITGLINGKFVVSIFGGGQKYCPAGSGSGTGGNTSAPSIAVSSLIGFSTLAGVQSASQSFTVTGSGLTSNVTVTPPAGYLISLDNSTFSSSVTITESGGTVNGTTVYVAISGSAAAGNPSGNITLRATGATPQNVAVKGTVASTSATEVVVMKGTVTNVASLTLNLSPYVGTYDAFKIFLYNVVPVNNTSSLYCQVSTNGTTFDSGSSDYSWQYWATNFTNNIPADFGIDLMDGLSNASSENVASVIEITNINVSSNYPFINSITSGTLPPNWTGDNVTICMGHGIRSNAQATQGLKFFMGTSPGALNGNIANMAYKVVGIHQ